MAITKEQLKIGKEYALKRPEAFSSLRLIYMYPEKSSYAFSDKKGNWHFPNLSELDMIEKTLDNLEEGDAVKNVDGYGRKVLFALKPGLYVMSSPYRNDRYGSIMSAAELRKYDYRVDSPEEAAEMTVAEISKLVGRTVKVVEEK